MSGNSDASLLPGLNLFEYKQFICYVEASSSAGSLLKQVLNFYIDRNKIKLN